MTPLTAKELAELARLELMARPGPLDVERRDIDSGYIDYVVHSAKGDFAWCRGELDHKAKANAALIAALRNAAPALIAAAQELAKLRNEALSVKRVIERTLACGQLEKLEDARMCMHGWRPGCSE